MNEQQVIDNALQLIRELFQNDSSGHDFYHSERVYQTAIQIAQKEGGNLFAIKLASLLHDVDDRKLFHTVNLENARNFMVHNNIDEVQIEEVCKIIHSVSYKGNDSIVPDTIEGKIVQDADRLDAIGAIGIARAFAFGGSRGRTMYQPDVVPNCNMNGEEYVRSEGNTINHFYEKLLKLKDMMNTQTAKEISENRHEYMERFLEEFYDEWNGRK